MLVIKPVCTQQVLLGECSLKAGMWGAPAGYLCKQPGHTTASCPHRIAPAKAGAVSGSPSDNSVTARLRAREWAGRVDVSAPAKSNLARWMPAVLKLHSRRCTCLEFHPTKDHIVLSGDKKGQVAVWNFEKVHERTVYNMNRALTNNLRFVPGSDYDCISASSDGKLRIFDVETGLDDVVLNLNPAGWIEGVTTEKDWGMLYALDASAANNLIITGDSWGFAHFVDLRSKEKVGSTLIHKKAKVNTIHVNPLDQNLLLTAGNDWMARLFDLRVLVSSLPSASTPPAGKKVEDAPGQLGLLEHGKVVNSAYFSPHTGRKVLTTCIDNRLRVWDFLLGRSSPEPDREIVHSHDFNRYLTPFRAEWDPKDPSERLFVVGRYISDVFDGQALHPIDIYDAGTGNLLTSLVDPNLTTICPVNKPHPRLEVLVTGSSRSLYAWRPFYPEEEGSTANLSTGSTGRVGPHTYTFCDNDGDGPDGEKKRRANGGAKTRDAAEEDDDDDDDDDDLKGKKKKRAPAATSGRKRLENGVADADKKRRGGGGGGKGRGGDRKEAPSAKKRRGG
eukprot:jgi/Botrbrau1/4441/Bobra.0348s0029.2